VFDVLCCKTWALTAALQLTRPPRFPRPQVHFCVSQNYDNLLLRSGFPEAKLAELHGNNYVESCAKCLKKHPRDFEVASDLFPADHSTGRACDACGGKLIDNIVHFGEALPWGALVQANAKSVGADLTVVLGSSLRVEPAAGLAFKAKRRAKRPAAGEAPRVRAVIVNLQPTPRDGEADLLIRARCDDVLARVAQALVPAWTG